MSEKSWTIELVLQEGQVQMRLMENERPARSEFRPWQQRAIVVMSWSMVLIGLRDLLSYL